MAELLTASETQVLAELAREEMLTAQLEVTEIIAVAEQGPPGRDGDASGGALLTANQLGEFDTEPKKAAARANLGLQVIDGGTFN